MVEENIVQISFFRTLGLSYNKSTTMYIQQVFFIGIFSQLLGLIIGTILGNIIIDIQYGYIGYMYPDVWTIIVTFLVSTILPIYIMKKQISKTKSVSPMRLLLRNKNCGYDVEDDSIKKYIKHLVIDLLCYMILLFLKENVNKPTYIIMSCIQVHFIMGFIQYLCVIILHYMSKISNKLLIS